MAGKGAKRKSGDEQAKPSEAKAKPIRTPREKWVRRFFWWVFLPVSLYALGGFAGVPLLLRHVGIPQLNKRLAGAVSVEKFRCNPFKLSLTLEGVTLADKGGVKVAGFDRFDGGFMLWDTLFKRGWHFDKAVVDSPEVNGRISKQGEINLVEIVRPMMSGSSEPIKEIPRLVVHRLGVLKADIFFEDQSTPTPFITEWRDLNFDLNELDTRPENENPHSLRAVSTNGESLEWGGSFFVNPLTSKGKIQIGGLDLSKLMPYLETRTQGKLVSGKLTAEVEYDVAPIGANRVLQAKVVKGQIENLGVELDGKPVLAAKVAGISDTTIDLDKRVIRVGNLDIDGGLLAADRGADGVISITRLEPATTGAAVKSGERVDPATIPYPIQQVSTALLQIAEDAVGEWNLAVESIKIANTTLRVSDVGVVRPVAYEFQNIAVQAGPVRSHERFKTPFKLVVDVKEGGKVWGEGVIEPFDRRAHARAKTEKFNLAPAGGWGPATLPEPLPAASLTSALASVDGDLSVDLSILEAGVVSWKGVVKLESTKLTHPSGGAEVAGVDTVALDGAAELDVSNLNFRGLKWDGKAELGGTRLGTPIAELDRFAAAKLEANGKASVLVAPEGAKLDWSGTAGVGGLDVAARVQGPVSLKVGQAASDGQLSVDAKTGATPAIQFAGRADVSGFQAGAPELYKSSIALGKGEVTGVKLDTSSKSIELQSVAAEGPELGATFPMLPAPGQGKLAKKDGKDAPKDAGKTWENPVHALVQKLGWSAKIQDVNVTGGAIRVGDDRPESKTELAVEQIEVKASSLSTDGQTVAELQVSSKVQSSGAFKLTGKADLFRASPVLDVQVNVSGVPAKPFDPFVGRYVGYLVDRGRVNSTIPIKIEDGKLTGTLDFALDQFHLGDATKSPDAPDVPIKMGLDLLRDGNDKVAGKIPLSGKVTDPNFSIVGLVWDAFFNLIFKAATAPFQILGALFGAAEGQDLSMVAFEPGSAQIAADALSNIDIMAKAMKERPSITLEAGGRYNVEADTPGLCKIILREQMLKRVQVGTPYIEKIDDKLYKSAVEAEWKERQRAAKPEGAAPAEGPTSFEQMEKDLLTGIEVPVDRFVSLAKRRAEAVVAVLVKDNGIPAERVGVSADAGEKLIADKPKVEFGVK